MKAKTSTNETIDLVPAQYSFDFYVVGTVALRAGIKLEMYVGLFSLKVDKIGITVGDDVKVILMEAKEDHPFVQVELMMPILPLVRVPDVDQAIEMAVRVEHGNRHTAMMHSRNVEKLTKMAKLIQTTIL